MALEQGREHSAPKVGRMAKVLFFTLIGRG